MQYIIYNEIYGEWRSDLGGDMRKRACMEYILLHKRGRAGAQQVVRGASKDKNMPKRKWRRDVHTHKGTTERKGMG